MGANQLINRFGLILMSCVSVLVAVGVVELVTFIAAPVTTDIKSYRLARPPAYHNSPYFSAEFIQESFLQPGGWHAPPGSTFLLPNDFSGKYFHSRDGVRVTTDQPDGAQRRILIFGSSTVYSSEVPDSLTISSLLQRKLNAGGFQRIAVFNYGLSAVTTEQILDRLRNTELKTNDIIVFYHGAQDIYQGVLLGRVDNNILDENRRSPLLIKALFQLAKYSYFAQYLYLRMEENFSYAHLQDSAAVDRAAEATAVRVRKNVEAAAKYTQQRGGRFLDALEPTIFTLAHHGEAEENLARRGGKQWRALAIAFTAGYPKLRDAFAGVDFPHEDWSSAFDDIGIPIHLDFCHVTERGNEAIAVKIMNALTSRGYL